MIGQLATAFTALIGAFAAQQIGLPLPWMLGPLLFTAAAAIAGLTVMGQPMAMPRHTRLVFVPIIGLMIGARVSPDILDQMLTWWPSLLAIGPVAMLIQLVNTYVLRKVAGYDRTTAYFAASPGGLVEAVLIGESYGGNGTSMAMQHFVRVTLAVLTVPAILSLALGNAVGSAAGVVMETGAHALTLVDVALLAAAAIVGAGVSTRLRLPAGIMVGPFLLSTLLHATGITAAQVPGELVKVSQLAIGAVLGSRFKGLTGSALLRGLASGFLALCSSLGIAALSALALKQLFGMHVPLLFISFAPGGLAEMSLISISLGEDPVFVAVHHIARISVAVMISPIVFRLLFLRSKPD
ncbi:AbrB family transcriptional regulator [Actibacterium sp. MT2.3-13A]|uniref:AbrB family transcriptional regulator n=1 Tax=Actibacterium sp. MT2.3-13A TaxID=2828332 RepID=UPI001BA953E3|nr:AbrB family transcriptional regulator [Actibacterium sp. MT2.3-13A]